MSIIMVVACGLGGEIGRKDDMPWPRNSTDMQFFRGLTMGHRIVMGRKTAETLPGALPGRENIVLSRNALYAPIAGFRQSSVGSVLSISSFEDVFIIGGEEIYRLFLPWANTIVLTQFLQYYSECDAFFPFLSQDVWKCEESVIIPDQWSVANNKPDFVRQTYVRRYSEYVEV